MNLPVLFGRRTILQQTDIYVGVLKETGRCLGAGSANTVHPLNPQTVVVGGSTVRAVGLLPEPAPEALETQVLPSVARRARVLPEELGEDAGARAEGAVGRLGFAGFKASRRCLGSGPRGVNGERLP